jgi:hypothetical protein
MENSSKHRRYLGLLLLALILLLNVFIAAGYYNLSKMELNPFYVWQTNIEKQHE